jgi:hypothetical protein
MNYVQGVVINLLLSGLAASAVVIVLVFIFGNLSALDQLSNQINAIGGVIFGVVFGYRLNTLSQKFKK